MRPIGLAIGNPCAGQVVQSPPYCGRILRTIVGRNFDGNIEVGEYAIGVLPSHGFGCEALLSGRPAHDEAGVSAGDEDNPSRPLGGPSPWRGRRCPCKRTQMAGEGPGGGSACPQATGSCAWRLGTFGSAGAPRPSFGVRPAHMCAGKGPVLSWLWRHGAPRGVPPGTPALARTG